MNDNYAIRLRDIRKSYYQGDLLVDILQNINLNVRHGEMIAIIGASGSGKSTLLHIAGLLDNADHGQVIICGNDCSDNTINVNTIRLQSLGFVYQYHHLLHDFNAIENVAMPKLIAGNRKAEIFKEAALLLDELGLSSKKYNMPGELSGGEQQRVAIARAMIHKPSVILADEPTGNLDNSTADIVCNLFITLVNKYNTALIIVTHNNLIANKMHKLYELKNGQLIDKSV